MSSARIEQRLCFLFLAGAVFRLQGLRVFRRSISVIEIISDFVQFVALRQSGITWLPVGCFCATRNEFDAWSQVATSTA